jgi:Protein of unknown function (DUF2800)
MSDTSPYPLRLSGAADWVRCAAWVSVNSTEQAALIEAAQDNTVRDEGTAMHWIAELLLGGTYPYQPYAPNGVELTDELLEGAQFYVDVLNEYAVGWHIEEQLQARRIHPTACGGKPDAFGRYLLKPRVVVADLKGGYIPVEVFPNWQFIGYLAAILDANPKWETDDLEVEFVVVQPRAYHRNGPVRRHVMLAKDCAPYIEALRMAAHIAMGEHAKAVAGEQCDNCNGRASCNVALRAGARAIEIAGEPDIHDLPVTAIDYEMQRLEDAAAMIKARLTGLQAQATQLIRRGQVLPHYALESGAGRLKWIDEAAALATGDLMGVDLRKPVKSITPTQAMQKLPKEMLEQYAHRQRGEVKLVRFDSNAAVKAFSHLTIKE